MEQLTGRVFNIQRFSVHDGPGIRDIVFVKGCPLKCKWCSNPESQAYEIQIGYNITKCLGTDICGYCIKACKHGALKNGLGTTVERDNSKCIGCRACVNICPTTATKIFGEDMTVEDVCKAVDNQTGVWRANGGITISGGEPLMQADFVAKVLEKLKKQGMNTALETSGYASWDSLEKVAKWCDTIHYDIKVMDREKHKELTGVYNDIILENLIKLRKNFPKINIIVRTPVIPGLNDSDENLIDTVKYLKEIGGVNDYELLPYHAYGSAKYQQIQMEYQLQDITAPNKEEVKKLNDKLRDLLYN